MTGVTNTCFNERLHALAQTRSADGVFTPVMSHQSKVVAIGCFMIVDTMRRFIYIHGCPDSEPMGVPRSHGCIRMHNPDIVELFDRVAAYTPVEIVED